MKMTIKEIRQHLGLTQYKLAEKLGTREVTVCRWERGKCKPHRLYQEKIEKLIKQIKKEIKNGSATSGCDKDKDFRGICDVDIDGDIHIKDTGIDSSSSNSEGIVE